MNKNFLFVLLAYSTVIISSSTTYYNRLMDAYLAEKPPFNKTKTSTEFFESRYKVFQEQHQAAMQEKNSLSPEQLELLEIVKEYATLIIDRKINLYCNSIKYICQLGPDGLSRFPTDGLANIITREVRSRRETEILRVALRMMKNYATIISSDYRLYERLHYHDDDDSTLFAVMHTSEFIPNITNNLPSYERQIKKMLEDYKRCAEKKT